jgi:hypothetical protein
MAPKCSRILLVLLASAACNVTGPTCGSRQKSGTVATISGAVGAGQLARHVVPYATEGSQNNVAFEWPGARSVDPPRLTIYATRSSCADFIPPPAATSGECAVLAQAGWFDGLVVQTLIVPHGRGNPEVLGNPPEYVLWVVGDRRQPVSYTASITWWYGPDC